MRSRLKQWWPALKLIFTLVVLSFVGRQFARDLQQPDLWEHSLHGGWLFLAAVVYLGGLGCSGLYWYRLLREMGQEPDRLAAVRAYYISHLGKYVPGRAWALLLRGNLVRGPRTRAGVAILAAFYEVLVTMSAGALVALVLFALIAPATERGFEWQSFRRLFRLDVSDAVPLDRLVLLLFAATLFAPLGTLVFPPVFNRLIRRLALPFQRSEAQPMPAIRLTSWLEGLGLTAVAWFLLALSLFCVFRALLPVPLAWSGGLWIRLTAYTSAAYIAGFVIVIVPSGLGIREYFLTLFLVPMLRPLLDEDAAEARAHVVLAVLVLRLVWTSSELVASGILYCLPAGQAGMQRELPLSPGP